MPKFISLAPKDTVDVLTKLGRNLEPLAVLPSLIFPYDNENQVSTYLLFHISVSLYWLLGKLFYNENYSVGCRKKTFTRKIKLFELFSFEHNEDLMTYLIAVAPVVYDL